MMRKHDNKPQRTSNRPAKSPSFKEARAAAGRSAKKQGSAKKASAKNTSSKKAGAKKAGERKGDPKKDVLAKPRSKKGALGKHGAKKESPAGNAKNGSSRKRSPKENAQAAGLQSRKGNAPARKAGKPQDKVSKKVGCDLCPVFGRCGGCSQLDVPYQKQLAAKQRKVADLFADLAAPEAMLPILGMDDPFRYRNKVISPYALAKRGARDGGKSTKGKAGAADRSKKGTAGLARADILTGMYAPGTHRLIPADTCAIENATAKRVTLAIRDIMARWNMEPYDEDAGTGFVRHAVVRVGHRSGEVLVTVVTNADEFPSAKSFCRELKRRVPEITTIVQNVNTRATNVILGQKERALYGPGFILDTLCGLSFRISSQSFYQVNSAQTEVLYDEALRLANLTGTETVIDAYCGTGTIGLVAAKRGARAVVGVDSVASAIRDAAQNARHNGIENARFVTADATDFMQELARDRVDGRVEGRAETPTPCHPERAKRVEGSPDTPAAPVSDVPGAFDAPGPLVLLMDPPRAGSTPEFLAAACDLAPERIVYISCNPTTQARDVRHLIEGGYTVTAIRPVDMFPHTDHVECVVSLSKASY